MLKMRLKIDVQFATSNNPSTYNTDLIKRNVKKAIESTYHTLVVNSIDVEFY